MWVFSVNHLESWMNFLQKISFRITHCHINSFLLCRATKLSGTTVGLAFMSTMCSPYHSVGIVQVCLKINSWFCSWSLSNANFSESCRFLFVVVDMTNNMDWTSNVETILHIQYKPSITIRYYLFHMLLDSTH